MRKGRMEAEVVMGDALLEWILNAYQMARSLDSEEKIADFVSAFAEATGEDPGEVRMEVVGIIRDVRSSDRAVAAGL